MAADPHHRWRGHPSLLATALWLALPAFAAASTSGEAGQLASARGSTLDILDLPTYDQVRGGGDPRQIELSGLILDGRDLPVALAISPAIEGKPAELAVEALFRGVGLEPRVAEDGSWVAETPLGLARLTRLRMRQIDGIDYASLDDLGEALGIGLSYDEASAAVIATTTWGLVAGATPSEQDVERPDAESLAPRTNLSYWRTEIDAVHSDRGNQAQVFTDVGGGLAGGFWRARYEDNLEGRQTLRDYAWIRTHGSQRWLLGNQRVNGHSLLNSFELTGVQMAWTNRPESLYGSRLGYGELVSGRIASSAQLRGSGPPGGIAELLFDGIPVARISIPLDGRYDFRDVDIPRGGTTRVQVALYERGGLGAPIRIEDRSSQVSDQILEQGTVLHYGGFGQRGNPLDDQDLSEGNAAFYEGRFGLLPGLTLDVAGQNLDDQTHWLVGGTMSLGRLGVYSAHLAETEGRQAWQVAGEGMTRNAYWRLLAREEDAGYRLEGLEPSHDRYAETGYRGERWSVGLVARDIHNEFLDERIRFVRPTAEWSPIDQLSFSVRPDLEGNYQYSVLWAPTPYSRVSAYLTEQSDRYEFEQRFSERWRVNAGRVEYLDRDRHSLLFSRDRRQASDLGLSFGALESEGRFGYLVSLDKQLRPGMMLRMQAYDDPLADGQINSGPVIQLGFVADFAVTPQGLAAGHYNRNLIERGGVTGDLQLPASMTDDGVFALTGASVWVDGQLRATIDDNGRFHVRDLKPGVYRVQVDEGSLPIEMRLERPDRWVEVRAGVVTPVSYPLSLRLGFGGRLLQSDGSALTGAGFEVLDAGGAVVSRGSSDAWGYYRVDDLPPGRYRITTSEAGRDVELQDEFKLGVDLRPPSVPESR